MAADDIGLQFILEFFDDQIGYLVDVGAHDGVKKGSMTRELMVKGWGGLLIEPLPEAFQLLGTAYQDNVNAICIQVACSNEEGEGDLYPCGGVSTLEKSWRDACDAWWDHVKYSDPIKVKKKTLKSLLKLYAPKKIDYLQIDTEGHDLMVLLGMNWNYNPDLIGL